jgi:hypothetical protein
MLMGLLYAKRLNDIQNAKAEHQYSLLPSTNRDQGLTDSLLYDQDSSYPSGHVSGGISLKHT